MTVELKNERDVKKTISVRYRYLSHILGLALMFFCVSGVSAQIIYNNGNLATGANANDGTAAPAGTQWSETPNPFGNTLQSNTSAGVSCSVTATVFRCTDDFNVPVGQSWTVSQVVVFAYQTGFAGGTSPITAGTLRIWNGRPGDVGSTIIFGDTTTNRLASSVDSGLWRIFSTVVGAGVNPPTPSATNRRVWQTTLNVSPSLVLTSGTYWVDWNTAIGTAAHFAPSVSYKGIRGIPGQSSRQFSSATSTWVDITDPGQFPTGAPTPAPYPQDFPFKLIGSVTGAPSAPLSRSMDFDGDNKTDFALARAASAVGQTSWIISKTTGGTIGVDWGLGVGFAGGDKATPADFDGDGSTDIAVWRSGAPGVASFYIFQSMTSTVRIDQFGQTGDDPTVVGDYDGDGKADTAAYRSGAQGTFYYRGSLSNPGGAVTATNWGLAGDIAIPGDFDGDRKFDYAIARNSGGQLTHYQLRSTAGVVIFPFGLSTDKIATGDFDADGRSDLFVARTNAGSFDWYILKSSTSQIVMDRFGNSATDIIALGDYDGDNRTDLGFWRSGGTPDQTFFIVKDTGSSPFGFEWGQSAGAGTSPDYPVANFSVK